MAKTTMKMPEDFLLKISRLGEKTDKIIPEVLKVGAEVVEKKVRSNLQSVIGSGTKKPSKSTGQLLAALGTSSAKQDKDGNFNVKIGFAENRTDGESNAKIANILEYGRHGQAAKPFLKPAKNATKSACENAMKSKLEEELRKL